MTHKTIFISDLHLAFDTPRITTKFLNLLDNLDESTDALYILGDLFEAYIGDDADSVFYQEIVAALKKTTDRGLPIYFMPGNRDFLVGKKFLDQTNCKLLKDPTKISLYGSDVLLMHGDTLCTQDIAYQKARKYLRHPLIKTMFLLLPLSLREKIAKKMRKKSMMHTEITSLDLMDVEEKEVERCLEHYNVTMLVHGHTHKPAFHKLELNDQYALRMVLGAWHEKGNMLIWEDNQSKKWVEF